MKLVLDIAVTFFLWLLAAHWIPYFKNTLVAFNQFCNTLLGGLPGETISARVGRLQSVTWLADLVEDWLNLMVPGHTTGAEKHDELRAEAVEKIEKDALK